MRQLINYKEAKVGDIIVFPDDYKIKYIDEDGDIATDTNAREFLWERVLESLGATIWRDVPLTFECEAVVDSVGGLRLHNVNQVVPTGKVKVTMEHVHEGPVS